MYVLSFKDRVANVDRPSTPTTSPSCSDDVTVNPTCIFIESRAIPRGELQWLTLSFGSSTGWCWNVRSITDIHNIELGLYKISNNYSTRTFFFKLRNKTALQIICFLKSLQSAVSNRLYSRTLFQNFQG